MPAEHALGLGLETVAIRPASRRLSTSPATHCHVFEWRSTGRPVLLLHGLGSNAATWLQLARDLDPELRPLAMDLRGHGDSSWTADYRLASFVRDLAVVREWIGQPFTIIGHSLGAEVAMHFAAHEPEMLEALVLVDIGAQMASSGRQRIRADLAASSGRYATLQKFVEELRDSYVLAGEPALWDMAAHGARPLPHGGYASKLDPALRTRLDPSPLARRETELMGFWNTLAMIRCPTLVVRGELSAILRRESAERIVRTLPFGRLEQVSRAGHAVMLDNPVEFGRVIARFLGETASR
jgi:pimeloyl-ACP methyl ester carboxylesterase